MAYQTSRLAFMTTRNVGSLDRLIRALPALVTTWAWWSGILGGLSLVAAAGFSAMLLVTTVFGACSIYYMLGWSTCPVSGKQKNKQ